MENQFVPYEIALQLKEKGFKELCIGWWYNPTGNDPDLFLVENRKGEDNNSVVLDPNKKEMRDVCNWKKICEESKYSCSAPLWQQVIDWFAEVHHIDIEPVMNWRWKDNNQNEAIRVYSYNILKQVGTGIEYLTTKNGVYNTRAEAIEEAIKKALTLI